MRFLLGILTLAVIIVLGYLAYVFVAYHRIEDNLAMEEHNLQTAVMAPGNEYLLLTYNIGFGAYEPDYGFFMDGGTESWALSEERLTANMDAMSEWVAEQNADIVILQEVDDDSTRTYHVDERDYFTDRMKDYEYTTARCFESPFLFYPFTQPHGLARSNLMTLSRFRVDSSVRRSLPVENTLKKIVDMDRCYTVHRIPVENGRELVLYNFHLSAYTTDGTIAEEQLKMIVADMQGEYEKGNYCIAGGDFNKDLSGDAESFFNTKAYDVTWAQPLPEGLFDDTNVRLVFAYDPENPVPSCRNADGPYNPDQFVLTIDGFMATDNVTVTRSEVADLKFRYSDHNPVRMFFVLN